MKTKSTISFLMLLSILFVFNCNHLCAQENAINIPDKQGTTIKGAILCDGVGIPDIRVSDGVITTTTDKNGYYWLPSKKHHGYVFYTIPGNYQPISVSNATPAFWSLLTKDNKTCEQHDFRLKEVNNDNYKLIVAADMHLANRKPSSTDDMNQFRNGFIDEVTPFIKEQELPIYTLVLGDMTWDYFWYSNNFGPKEYVQTVYDFPSPMFHVIGNHDYDPYVAEDDFKAEVKYKKALGPTYYSMNIGKVHYIILDNMKFINIGGKDGKLGKRNYSIEISDIQKQWLKEDLKAIKDKSTPIIAAFHCPASQNTNPSFEAKALKGKDAEVAAFHKLFSEFSDVQFMSGHTHVNANIEYNTNISMEHNIAAICETWWWSGKLSHFNVSKDGTPSGYKVFDIDDKNIKWYYKGINNDRNTQFCAYDMNEVKALFSSDTVKTNMEMTNRGNNDELLELPVNSVLLNIWDYDSKWKISVKENGKPLDTERILVRDPNHRLYFESTYIDNFGKVPNKSYWSAKSSHMFLVKTQSPTSSLEIIVTDRFGNEFKETMIRPKKMTASF